MDFICIKVWPFLFSHYSFESTIDERNDIDRTTIERYNSLTNEWHNAEHIVTQIDLQHSNNRKNTLTKLFNSNLESNNQNSIETTLTTIKNVLASIPEKISLTNFNTLERKDSNASNDVFYEVKLYNYFQISILFLYLGMPSIYCNYPNPRRIESNNNIIKWTSFIIIIIII